MKKTNQLKAAVATAALLKERHYSQPSSGNVRTPIGTATIVRPTLAEIIPIIATAIAALGLGGTYYVFKNLLSHLASTNFRKYFLTLKNFCFIGNV